MKKPLKEMLKKIGGGHLLKENDAVVKYSDELGAYVAGLRPKIAGLKFSVEHNTGSWLWEDNKIGIYATWGWEGKQEVPIEPDDQAGVVKTLKYKYTGDLKKDAKWYISNMKRYLPGIKKDMDYSQGTW